MKSTYDRIYESVKLIPRGKVATYGQIAAMAGNENWARIVGNALHVNPDPMNIPCHRVVNAKGEMSQSFAFGGARQQKELLEQEGIVFEDEKVNLKRYKWNTSCREI